MGRNKKDKDEKKERIVITVDNQIINDLKAHHIGRSKLFHDAAVQRLEALKTEEDREKMLKERIERRTMDALKERGIIDGTEYSEMEEELDIHPRHLADER